MENSSQNTQLTEQNIPAKKSHTTLIVGTVVVFVIIVLLIGLAAIRARRRSQGQPVGNVVNTTSTNSATNTTANSANTTNNTSTNNSTSSNTTTSGGSTAPATPLSTGDHTLSLSQGSVKRTYIVHVPTTYTNAPTPLVFNFHGSDSTGSGQENNSHMNITSDANNFIVVYPDGINKNWADGRTYTANQTNHADDVAFVKSMISELSKQLNIDTHRIYATGMSNGGMMAYRLACEMTQTFVAIAPVSSAFTVELKSVCKPSGAIPVLIMHGTTDPLLPYNGGNIGTADRGQMVATTEAVSYWVNNNGASSTPVVTNFANTVADGTSIVRNVYGSGTNQVQFFKIIGGGHTWANGLQYLPARVIGLVSRDMDASNVIWDFFKMHTR